jgi:hypothetical protein
VRGREQLAREDRELLDPTGHRPLVRAPDARAVGRVDEHRLPQHRQVAVARGVDAVLTDEAELGRSDPADEKGRRVRLLPGLELVEQDDRDLRLELHAE